MPNQKSVQDHLPNETLDTIDTLVRVYSLMGGVEGQLAGYLKLVTDEVRRLRDSYEPPAARCRGCATVIAINRGGILPSEVRYFTEDYPDPWRNAVWETRSPVVGSFLCGDCDD